MNGRPIMKDCTAWTKPGRGTTKHPTLSNGEIEDQHRPRIVSKAIDAHRADVRFKPVKGHPYWPGIFPSLLPLAEALSGGTFETLTQACEAFEIPLPTRRDGSLAALVSEVRTMSTLYVRLLSLHRELSPDRPPDSSISSGTYARAVLHRTGIDPPLARWPEFPREVLSATMGAYFGGELFVHARTRGLPMMTLDFRGAYAASALLVGAWDVLAAERAEVVDQDPGEITARIQALVEKLKRYVEGSGPPPTQEDWRFAAWTTVFLEPGGALLPTRAKKGETWVVRRRPLMSRRGPLPYQVADVLVHCLEGGAIPRIVRAFNLRPHRRIDTRAVRLPSGGTIDPRKEDPILTLIREGARVENDPTLRAESSRRLKGIWKGIRNALVSGLPIQVNDDEPTKKLRRQIVFDPRTGLSEELRLPRIESPGAWEFPPIAAAVTSGSRLLLHLAIATVREMGGIVAYWDTDSIFVVATPSGDLLPFPGGPLRTIDGRPAIRALSYGEVREVRERIELLFPFAHVFATYVDVPTPDGLWKRVTDPGLLRVEPENRIGPAGFPTEVRVAVRSPKRYVGLWVERPSQHVELDGNHQPVVVDPTPDEVRAQTRIRVKRASEHGLPYLAPKGRPDWIAEGLEHFYRLHNDLQTQPPDWWDEPAIVVVSASFPNHVELHPDARPHSSLAVSQTPLLGPLVAPWHDGFDPASATWFDLTGREVRAIYPGTGFIGEALGQAMRRVWYSVDHSALDPEGIPANLATEGLLSPSPVVATVVHKVGKESRHLGAGRGILSGTEHVSYGSDDYWPDLLEALSLLACERSSKAAIAAEAEISTRWLEEIIAGRHRPAPEVEQRILSAVANMAGDWIRETRSSVDPAGTNAGILGQYLDLSPSAARRCQECGRLLTGRQRSWCSDAHRKRFERSRTEQLKLI